MQEDDAVAALEHLGLTTYEAKVFIALQKLGAGTARDVHRVADVPRSQVYSAAENLEERGLVDVQQSNPMKYRPVSIEDARTTLRDRFEREEGRAFEYVESVRRDSAAEEEQEDIWTIRGRENVSDRVVNLAADAEEWVAFGAASEDLVTEEIVDALAERAAEGVQVVVISESPVVRALFDDTDGVHATGPVESQHQPDDDRTGRVLFADDDILLLSVLGEEEIPGINRETAFWSAHSHFASVLIQLIQARQRAFEI